MIAVKQTGFSDPLAFAVAIRDPGGETHLPDFDVSVIGGYFPAFEDELPRYLEGPGAT